MSAKRLNLPDTASVAHSAENGKLHAPSAARNVDAIIHAMQEFVPASGKALEIASGTGEHIIRFAAAFPAVTWQPTDVDPDRLTSIAAWRAEVKLPNILAPILLDATTSGWARDADLDLIILSNLLHLISVTEAATVITESAKALNSGGVFLIYGPFMRDTEFASEGDRRFHESLHGQDPDIGYKSFQSVQDIQRGAGLKTQNPIEMPANNLMLVATKA